MVLIRVDDFPSGSATGEISPTYRRDFARFHAAMGDLPYLLGVVPAFVKPGDVDWLRSLGSVEIACHGITHRRGEFDLPLKALCENLREADRTVHTAAFIPPFNAISAPLLAALQAVGYKLVTTGPESDRTLVEQYRASSLRLVPSPWYGYARDLLVGWRTGERPGRHDCLTLHWTWERNEGLGAMMELAAYLAPHTLAWKTVYPEVFGCAETDRGLD